MKAGIYARVSTTDQNCEMQLSELRHYAKARGWEIFSEYVDTGFSGKNANRPEVKRCLEDAKLRKLDVILVYKLDRWGRTVAQLSTDIQSFDSMGIRFIAVTQGIDTDKSNPTSRLMLNIMSAIAEFERELILERIASGVKNAKENGTRSGKAIGRPKAVFERDKAEELRKTGMSIARIAEELGTNRGTVYRALQGVTKPLPLPLPFSSSLHAS
jgi:putative DNA-invertase from lambdoid prophage Rac